MTPIATSSSLQSASSAASRAIAVAFTPVDDLAQAQDHVRRFARGQYENFSVVSLLVPRALRQDFYNLYSFCRAADDLGDEVGDAALSLQHLAALRDAVNDCYSGRPVGAVFTALRETIQRHDIPREPFLDLISAFEQDQRIHRYETFDQLLDYCRRSADPVGRLVLYVNGYRDAERQRLSDATCSALQVANFLQDVRRDLERLDRIYLPTEWMKKFGVTVSLLQSGVGDRSFRELMRYGVDRTEELFAKGDALLPLLSAPVAAHVALFAEGGRAVLSAIHRKGYDTLASRPKISRWAKARLIGRAMGARTLTAMFGIGRHV